MLKMKVTAFSSVGRRSRNEDNLLLMDEILPVGNHGTDHLVTGEIENTNKEVLAVFDGIGGEQAGNMAAFLGADALREYMKKQRSSGEKCEMNDLCRNMNRKICEYAAENKIRHMGTTIAMVYMENGKLTAVNLGDSRIYRYRDSELTQMSVDHAQSTGFLGGRALTQFLGIPEEEFETSPNIAESICRDGDIYFLCSDGVTDTLTETELRMIFEQNNTPEEKADKIRTEVELRKGKDNATVILAAIREEPDKGIAGILQRLRWKRSK